MKSEFDYITVEHPSAGLTYQNDSYSVYGYGVYGSESVLEGQTKRVFLDSFETLDEALEKYPEADFSDHSLFTPVCVSHLPEGEFL